LNFPGIRLSMETSLIVLHAVSNTQASKVLKICFGIAFKIKSDLYKGILLYLINKKDGKDFSIFTVFLSKLNLLLLESH